MTTAGHTTELVAMDTLTEQDTLLDLLRHGEPEGGGRFRGALTDDPLTALGWQQMQASVGTQASWQAIISSPMRRCAEFARHLASTHQLPLQLEHELREMHFGDWEGLSADYLHQHQSEALANFWRDPQQYTPPGAEPMSAFQQRVLAGLFHQLDQHQADHLLLVAHGGSLRMILCHLLAMPLSASARLELPYACLSRVRMRRDRHGQWHGSLVFHGGAV